MRTSISPRRRRRRAGAFPFLLVFALATMLLGPIADQVAIAQADSQQEQPGEAEEPVQPTEEPAQPTEEPVVVTEEAVATEELVATEAPTEAAAPESVTLTITVYRCDHPEFDTGFSENLQRVINECTGPGSGTFAISDGVSEQTGSGTSLTFEIVGGLVLVESIPAGYDNPIANCFLYNADGSLGDQIGPGETSGGGWKVGGIRDGDVHCDWYQVDRGLGAVYVVNMACPSTAALFPEPSMTDLVAMCTEPAGQKQFFVVHGGGLERMVPSGGEFNDALFEAIKTGPIEIWMDDPAGFDKARVFCQVTTLEGAEISPFAEVSVGDFRASGMTLVAGQRIHCSWFNIQEGPGLAQPDEEIPDIDEAPTPTVPAAPTDLTIVLHTCQPNYDPEAANADPDTDCPEGPDGVTFTLASTSDPDDTVQAATGDVQPNAVTFPGLSPGDYTITQDVPNNIGTVFVLGCGGGGGVGPVPQFIDGTLETSIPQGVILTCHWFNIRGGQNVVDTGSPEAAASETGRIVIQTSVCPDANVDPGLGVEGMAEACNQRQEGVSFQATAGDGYDQSQVSVSTGTVMFEDVPAGAATITETIPEGFGDPIVFCTAFPPEDELEGPFPYEQVTVTGGSIARTVEAGIETNCSWFNVPGTPTAESSPEASPTTSRALEGTGSITIAKYNCPAGFDVSTIDANPQAMCTPAQGISFDIDDTADDNSGYSVETDATGMATLSDLPADTYYIEEGVRNGTTATFVWDCYDAAGSSSRTDPLKIGSSLSYELGDGEQVRCDFYNVVGGTSRVVIAKHACDYLVPAYTLDQAGLAAQCTIDTGTVNMTIVSDIYQETQPASNNPLTLASFANVPSGYMAVVEENIPGWATAIVYCGIYDENGTVVAPVAQSEVIQGRSIYLNLAPGQVASCDWYNVAQGFVDVTVNKHLCPEGFDAYAASPNDLALGCTQDPGSVKFSLHDESLYYEERTITAAAPGTWTDVPSGDIRIEEMALPTGFGMPIVVCRIDFEDGSAVSGPSFQPLSGSTWTYVNLSAGQVLTCDWYNVPGGEGAVSIWKMACPETVNVAEMTKHELDQMCQESIPDITFDLTVSTTVGTFTDSATSTNLFRYADFPAIPRGEVTVTERPVSPWTYSVVYCHTQSETGPVTDDVLVPVSEQGSITQFVDSGDWLICSWYNAYEPKNVVEVMKYTCPEGTGYDEELRFYIETCTTPGSDGIEFTLTASDGIGVGYTAGGKVLFENVPVGPVSIQERIPEEYGEPVVFCEFVLDDTPLVEPTANRVETTDGTVPFVFDGLGQRFACYWYNIPDHGSTIVVHKYTCPEGTSHEEDAGWFAENCTEAHEGVDFTLTAGMGTSTLPTDASGEVEWTGVPLGSFSIQEAIPYEYGQPVVFCGIVSSSGGQIDAVAKPVDAPNGYLSGEIGYPATLYVCYWFNIPDGPGDLTIYKYTCPAGYDLHAWDANPREDCPDATNGIAFTLGGPATELTATTGDSIDGAAYFDEIAPGSYTVTESVPEGMQYVFVLDCYGQDRGSLRPYPLALGDTLEIQVGSGESIACYWYNVPGYDPGSGKITVTKYLCSTKTYVSDVDCEIYEDGATFDLVFWDGDSWEYADTQTTDGGGMIAWTNVDPGQYWLDEHDGDWCQISSPQISDDGNWINVNEDEETTIAVYNCGGTPGTPGKTPMKYPDTGVPPADHRRDQP